MTFQKRLGCIGFGNMAGAIVGGILRERLLTPAEIGVFDPDEGKRQAAARLGLTVFADNASLAAACETVLLAVKPQMSAEVFAGTDFSHNVVVSIMAGIRLEKLAAATGAREVARVMPNTPCLVGKGAIALDAGRLSPAHRAFVTAVLASTGNVVELPDDKMDAVTAVSGSGPAYVYLFMQGMVEEGVRLGLSEAQARELTAATFAGAAELTAQSGDDLETLIANVCSKGGTTIRAVESFREDGLADIIARAMKKCFDRSVELGK